MVGSVGGVGGDFSQTQIKVASRS